MTRKTEVGMNVAHPLVQKTMVDTTTGQQYLVQTVKKDWLDG